MARGFPDRHILKSPNSYAIVPKGGPKHTCGSRFTRAATVAIMATARNAMARSYFPRS